MATLSLWLLLASVLAVQAYAADNEEGGKIFTAFDDAGVNSRRVVRSDAKESTSNTHLEDDVEKRVVKRRQVLPLPPFWYRHSQGLEASEEDYTSPGSGVNGNRRFIYFPPPGLRGYNEGLESSERGDSRFIYFPPVESRHRAFIYFPPPGLRGYNEGLESSERGDSRFIYFPPVESSEEDYANLNRYRGNGYIPHPGNRGIFFDFNPPPGSRGYNEGLDSSERGGSRFIYFPPVESTEEDYMPHASNRQWHYYFNNKNSVVEEDTNGAALRYVGPPGSRGRRSSKASASAAAVTH